MNPQALDLLKLLSPEPAKRPPSKKIKQLLALPPYDQNEIFTHRLLCRRGLALFVGPSGVGKSTLLAQGIAKWARGMEHLGLRPVKKLRCLLIQAENDDYDLREQFASSIKALQLDPKQIDEIDEMIDIVPSGSFVGDEFCQQMEGYISEYKADIVIIDPALAYLGGDSNSQADVSHFIRQGILRVLERTNTAGILVHHVAKPSSGKNGPRSRTDSYAGAGSAEFSNASRFVFGISPTDVPDHFELFLGKRGKRAGWKDAEGNPVTRRIIKHAPPEQGLLWLDVPQSEFDPMLETASKPKREPTLEEFMSLFPAQNINDPKASLLTRADIQKALKKKGWEDKNYARLRDAAEKTGKIEVFKGPSNLKLTGLSEAVTRYREFLKKRA